MIASITDTELSFGSFTAQVLRREAVPALQRMGGQLLSRTDGAGDAEAEARKAARLQAVEALKKSWSELSRPLGGKWWKTREELYDA